MSSLAAFLVAITLFSGVATAASINQLVDAIRKYLNERN